jgi:hypothetical protein
LAGKHEWCIYLAESMSGVFTWQKAWVVYLLGRKHEWCIYLVEKKHELCTWLGCMRSVLGRKAWVMYLLGRKAWVVYLLGSKKHEWCTWLECMRGVIGRKAWVVYLLGRKAWVVYLAWMHERCTLHKNSMCGVLTYERYVWQKKHERCVHCYLSSQYIFLEISLEIMNGFVRIVTCKDVQVHITYLAWLWLNRVLQYVQPEKQNKS